MNSTQKPFENLSPQAQSLLSVLSVLPSKEIASSFIELHFSFVETQKEQICKLIHQLLQSWEYKMQ